MDEHKTLKRLKVNRANPNFTIRLSASKQDISAGIFYISYVLR